MDGLATMDGMDAVCSAPCLGDTNQVSEHITRSCLSQMTMIFHLAQVMILMTSIKSPLPHPSLIRKGSAMFLTHDLSKPIKDIVERPGFESHQLYLACYGSFPFRDVFLLIPCTYLALTLVNCLSLFGGVLLSMLRTI